MSSIVPPASLKFFDPCLEASYFFCLFSYQCIIGVAYSRGKDQSLVVDCFRDMFRLCAKQGWGMPAGLEVENHLMTQYKEGILQAGDAFSWIRY